MIANEKMNGSIKMANFSAQPWTVIESYFKRLSKRGYRRNMDRH